MRLSVSAMRSHASTIVLSAASTPMAIDVQARSLSHRGGQARDRNRVGQGPGAGQDPLLPDDEKRTDGFLQRAQRRRCPSAVGKTLERATPSTVPPAPGRVVDAAEIERPEPAREQATTHLRRPDLQPECRSDL